MTSKKLPNGFVCWNTDGLDLIESDVGKLKSDESSDESIIQAVHQHVDVTVEINEVKASLASILEGGRKNRDTKLIEAFRAAIKNDDIGSVLMSVVGDTGSGKSHLVRWLYHEIEPNDEKYIKLWVPRRENAQRFLIKKLIEDLAELGSARATELRMKLEVTVKDSKDSPQAVVASLFSHIVDGLQHEESLREPNSKEAAQYRKMFIGDIGDTRPDKFLWQVLNDVKNQEAELQDGLSKHLKLVVDSIGQLSSEDENETSPVLDDKRVKKLLNAYQKVVKDKLAHNSYEYLFGDALSNISIITDLLNEAIEIAVNNVLNVQGANIREVFSEVREELGKHGKQLLIFVEDFSAISGSNAGLGKLQRDLMAMFTESADGKLAPIRVAMAVTNSTFDALESNFQQRMHFIIKIDDAFNELKVEPFMASYLRLARTTKQELNAARAVASETEVNDGTWVPNKCTSCPYRDECFSIFEHENGVGFYPLTRNALIRISNRNQLTPRGRISRLKNILMSIQGDFSREEMPSQAVEAYFGPNSGTAEWDSDRNQMLRIDFGLAAGIEGQSKARLQRYVHNWSAGARPSDVEFRVFGLPVFDELAEGTGTSTLTPETGGNDPTPPVPTSSKLQENLDRVNRWLQAKENEDLGQVFTSTLESAVRSYIVGEVTSAFGRQFTGATLEDYSKQIGLRFVDASIRVEGVPTQGTGAPELLRPYFEIPRNEEGANILRGVLYLEALKNGVAVTSEIPASRRPLLLSAVTVFLRDLVEELCSIVHRYELLEESVHSVAAKLLHFMQLSDASIRDLDSSEFISRWLTGEIEIENAVGPISSDCVSFYQSMEEMRLSLFSLLQVTQEESTSKYQLQENGRNKNQPHYWRIVHLVDQLDSIKSGLIDTLTSIDLSANSERIWFAKISTSITDLLRNYANTNVDSLKTRLADGLDFVSQNLESTLVDQVKWVATNVDPLMAQSAFQTSRDQLVSVIREITETIDLQTTKVATLKSLEAGDFNADEVLKNARDIDEIFVNSEKYRFLASQLEYAVSRLNSMSAGGATAVIQAVLDFEKLASPEDVAELGKE